MRAQLGFFLNFLILETFLLAVMAYDRYVAICDPLLYMVIKQSHCWPYTPRKPELKETYVPQCSS